MSTLTATTKVVILKARPTAADSGVLSKTDLIIGTVIALVMATAFTALSSGLSLIVTFVPGMVFAWLTYVWLYIDKRQLPKSAEFLPVFFVALAVQFIHFAEEFITGFRTSFPSLYGGAPYSADLFVAFNMAAYFIFTLTCILVFAKSLRFLLVPSLFFIIYGAIGNAISHTWWSVYLQAYFPGLVTAQIYWIVGPFVLYKLLGRAKIVLLITILFALVLIPLLTIFASSPTTQIRLRVVRLLATVVSFPLAYLFELGGNTTWAPTLLHFVIQATVKVVVFSHGAESFALAWMAASAIVPLLVFTLKAPTRR